MKYQNSIRYVSLHPWLKKSYAKLRKPDLKIIDNFFSVEYKDINDAMMACNRMFMDGKIESKNKGSISEIVSAVISHYYLQSGAQ